MDEKIENYIKENLEKGFSPEEIKSNLLAFGRNEKEIDQIFFQLKLTTSASPTQTTPPWKNYKNTDFSKDDSANQTTQNDSGDSTKTKIPLFIKFIPPILIFLGLLIYIFPKLNLSKSSNIKRSFSVSPEIHEKYFPLWNQLFIKENEVDENFFNKNITPIKTDLESNDSEKYFVVEYEYNFDWVSVNNKDKILIKQKGQEKYLLPEELIQLTSLSGEQKSKYIQFEPIIKVSKIIPKSEAQEKLKECRLDMKEASKPFKISSFSQESGKIRLLYRGIYIVSSNQYVLGEIDLETGEVNCIEADMQYSF